MAQGIVIGSSAAKAAIFMTADNMTFNVREVNHMKILVIASPYLCGIGGQDNLYLR